jgi:hypothetical protein
MASTTNGGATHQNPGSQGPQSNPYLTPLESSFLNTEPQDEFVREIADWIAFISGGAQIPGRGVNEDLLALLLHLGRPDIEIEAKFGMVLDKGSGTRTAQRLGILVETRMFTIPQCNRGSNVSMQSLIHAMQTAYDSNPNFLRYSGHSISGIIVN